MTKHLISGSLKRLSRGDWLPLICRAQAGDRVALTFDDGPSPASTPPILDLLRRHGATATFFLSGMRAEAHPDLVRRIVAEGHPVYSHGYAHIRVEQRSRPWLSDDLTRAEAALSRLRPTPSPYLIRLPYGSGHGSARIHRALRAWRRDCRLVHWRHSFDDASLSDGCASEPAVRVRCAAAVERALADPGLRGSVILLHESPIGLDLPLAKRVGPILLEILLDRLAAERIATGAVGAGRQLPIVGRCVRIVGA